MIKAPSPHNDTTRRYPRTLGEAFPSAPEWQDEAPLADRVVIYLGCFVAGYLTALLVFA
jgi:hypothetical protein